MAGERATLWSSAEPMLVGRKTRRAGRIASWFGKLAPVLSRDPSWTIFEKQVRIDRSISSRLG
jgi:hypothetical protein